MFVSGSKIPLAYPKKKEENKINQPKKGQERIETRVIPILFLIVCMHAYVCMHVCASAFHNIMVCTCTLAGDRIMAGLWVFIID